MQLFKSFDEFKPINTPPRNIEGGLIPHLYYIVAHSFHVVPVRYLWNVTEEPRDVHLCITSNLLLYWITSTKNLVVVLILLGKFSGAFDGEQKYIVVPFLVPKRLFKSVTLESSIISGTPRTLHSGRKVLYGKSKRHNINTCVAKQNAGAL